MFAKAPLHPFSAYNQLKAWNRRANRPIDIERLNRALGIVLSKHPKEGVQYVVTTLEYCSCSDWMYRRVNCKHQIALLLRKIMIGDLP